MANTLTETDIKTLPVPAKAYTITYFAGRTVDGYTAPKGFAVRVTATGARSFLLCYTDAAGAHRTTIGAFPAMRLAKAVREAAKMRLGVDGGAAIVPKHAAKVRAGKARREALAKAAPKAAPKTVNDVLDDWVKAHGGLRSLHHREGTIDRYLRPALGPIPLTELRKRPIVDMLDAIRANVGAATANVVLTNLSAALNWYEARGDDYIAPSFKGLKTSLPSRDRILSHVEIATLWPAFEQSAVFGLFCKLLLLTGQRRNDIADACWGEIDMAGARLTVPARRYKTGVAHDVPLSAPVVELLASLPRRPGSDRLFAPELGGFDYFKKRLDALAPIAHWTLHDLRRTATSLMAEAGIRPDHIERVTHPPTKSVANIYNRYSYLGEKRAALDALAAMVAGIVNPSPTANVVPLRSTAAAG